MSEEMKELQTNEVTETMADYEDHFDDANPWNRVQDYMDKKTVLPVKIVRCCQRWRNCNGRRTSRIRSGF